MTRNASRRAARETSCSMPGSPRSWELRSIEMGGLLLGLPALALHTGLDGLVAPRRLGLLAPEPRNLGSVFRAHGDTYHQHPRRALGHRRRPHLCPVLLRGHQAEKIARC